MSPKTKICELKISCLISQVFNRLLKSICILCLFTDICVFVCTLYFFEVLPFVSFTQAAAFHTCFSGSSLFCVCGKISLLFTILTVFSVQFSGVNSIHNAVQPSHYPFPDLFHHHEIETLSPLNTSPLPPSQPLVTSVLLSVSMDLTVHVSGIIQHLSFFWSVLSHLV